MCIETLYNNIAAMMIIPNINRINLIEFFKYFSACFFSEGNCGSSIIYTLYIIEIMEIMLPSW